MGSKWILSAVLLSLAVTGKAMVLDKRTELSVIVKREAVDTSTPDAEPATSSSPNPQNIEVTEPALNQTVAATEGSLLDVFSTSSKEKKPQKAAVQSLHINSDVKYRYAKTRVESKVVNPAEVAQEVFFEVVIPETAFISGFSMEIDDKVYNAYVKEKEEAQKVYDAAVKMGVSAGHVKQSARDSNRFSVSVNVEPLKKVKFNLTYEELLERKYGHYRHAINVNPGQIVPDLQIIVELNENRNIIDVKVPEFHSGNEIYPVLEPKESLLAKIERLSPSNVKITFKPTVDDQKKLQEGKKDYESVDPEGLSGQFAVQYDVERDSSGGEILVNDGYFVHFFAPPEIKPLKKHVIFVLDVSGSMAGRKIEQLQQAMMSILDQLDPLDYFNIIEFAYTVTVRNLDLEETSSVNNPFLESGNTSTNTRTLRSFPATSHYINKGKDVIKKMTAAGGTNIYDALDVAIEVARSNINSEIGTKPSGSTSEQPESQYIPPQPMIIFLTDGEPTVGITTESGIIKNVDHKNKEFQIPIFSLAFGTDADFNLLKRISLLNGAFSRKIYEAADTSLQLNNFYKLISSPKLSNVKFVYPPEEVKNETITKINFPRFFGGSELVVAGKLEDKVGEVQNGYVEAQAVDGTQNYSVCLHCVDFTPHILRTEPNYRPLERLWAYLTIKKLLDEAELMTARSYLLEYDGKSKPGESDPKDQALKLALEAVKNAVNSFIRLLIDGLISIFKLLRFMLRYMSNDFIFTDSLQTVRPKTVNEKITELAVKYSFVCPLTSLVVVKPGFKVDANVEPAEEDKTWKYSRYSSPLSYRPVPLGIAAPAGVNFMSKMGGPPAPSSSFDTGFATRPGFSAAASLWTSKMPDVPEMSINSDQWSNGSKPLSLDDITWLSEVLSGGVFRFPGDSTEYNLGRNETNNSFGPCNILSKGTQGECRHLEYCVVPDIVSDLDNYHSNFFCTIPGNYVGVCCE